MEVKDWIVRGWVTRHCGTAKCWVGLGGHRCAGGWREGRKTDACQENRECVERQRKEPWSNTRVVMYIGR